MFVQWLDHVIALFATRTLDSVMSSLQDLDLRHSECARMARWSSCLVWMDFVFESNRDERWKRRIVIDAHSNFRTSPVVDRRVRFKRVFV